MRTLSDLCERAVAYLMPRLTVGDEATVKLLEPDSPVISDLNNGLLIGYLVDQEDHFQYIQRRHLVDAGMTEAMLRQNAVNNLAALVGKKGAKVQPYGDCYAVFFGGNFEASLVLVDTLWDEHLSHLAPNGFVIAIPNRDMLAFCDAMSETGVEQLRQIIGRVEGGDHPITATLYRRDPVTCTWQPYAN
jgi:uncharacterized protein YtpQ (UPF0354 family)